MLLNEIFHGIIRFSGTAFLMRRIFARDNVSIVLYHNPSAKSFNSHLKYLSNWYNFISLTDLTDAIVSKDWKKIPKYAMVITFDDGWKENYDLLDLIIKYKLKPTIFLTSHLINTDRNYWWSICNESDLNRLIRIPNNQRLMELKEKYDYYPEKEYPGRRQSLNIKEINQMKEFVEFGLHTCFHPILTNCSDEEKRSEIKKCKIRLEKILDKNIYTFAYPNGSYDNKCIEILKELGLKVARTVDVGWNSDRTDPYKLKTLYISDNVTINKLASQLTGIPLYLQYLLKGNLKGLY